MARGGDTTLALLKEGYAFLPGVRRKVGSDVVELRLMGQRVVAGCGPQWTECFYDEAFFHRSGALPEPILSTLFGHGAVHTLDGDAHRHRKDVFLRSLTASEVGRLAELVGQTWDESIPAWQRQSEVVLQDASAEILLDAVSGWAGLPVSTTRRRDARDMTAMVDGFGTFGRRHWAARLARQRQQKRIGELVERCRAGELTTGEKWALGAVSSHQDPEGAQLPTKVAAVELLNLIRPTVAISWFIAYAAHALQTWPQHRECLLSGEPTQVLSFIHELRRWYPFAQLLGAQAVRELSWQNHRIRPGQLVLLDVYGQNHHPDVWQDADIFDPSRFLRRQPGRFDLIPQGGGDPATGHRCPGEDATIGVLAAVLPRLAALRYDVPVQDLSISLSCLPAKVASGFVITNVRR